MSTKKSKKFPLFEHYLKLLETLFSDSEMERKHSIRSALASLHFNPLKHVEFALQV